MFSRKLAGQASQSSGPRLKLQTETFLACAWQCSQINRPVLFIGGGPSKSDESPLKRGTPLFVKQGGC